jgi:hypothetical protein
MGQAHNLSPHILENLEKQINQDYGGFTVKSHGPNVGQPAKDSYMVGLAQHGQNNMALPITAQQISDFAESRGDALSEDANYLGGFNDTAKGERGKNPGSLDVSKAFPRSGGLALPMMQAYYGGKRPEDSIGILNEKGEYGGEIPTINPIGMLYYHDE